MAKNNTVRVTDEELEILKKLREQQVTPEAVVESTPVAITAAQQALADAFVSAIERTKAPEKKTPFTRKQQTPWSPPPGVPRVKMKRKMFHHGIPLGENVSNEEIELMNKVKPGVYCGGFVRVTLRKDRGIDIDYPVKTASQRLRLVNQFGVRSFAELLERIIDEKANPSKYRSPEDAGLYDLDE